MQELIDELNQLCGTTAALSAYLVRLCLDESIDLTKVKTTAGVVSRCAEKAQYLATKLAVAQMNEYSSMRQPKHSNAEQNK